MKAVEFFRFEQEFVEKERELSKFLHQMFENLWQNFAKRMEDMSEEIKRGARRKGEVMARLTKERDMMSIIDVPILIWTRQEYQTYYNLSTYRTEEDLIKILNILTDYYCDFPDTIAYEVKIVKQSEVPLSVTYRDRKSVV